MLERAEELIREIRQIREQYDSEVGSRRKPWPKAIKDRILELDSLGVPRKSIVGDTGVPYHTIQNWRYQSRRRGFKELSISKIGTVTVPKPDILNLATVTVTTTKGIRVEISGQGAVSEVIRILSRVL
jgi:hypothetical protein